MHIESARPKLAPITSFVSPTVYSDPLICAPRVKINVMPIPAIYTCKHGIYKAFQKTAFCIVSFYSGNIRDLLYYSSFHTITPSGMFCYLPGILSLFAIWKKFTVPCNNYPVSVRILLNIYINAEINGTHNGITALFVDDFLNCRTIGIEHLM